MGRSHANGCPRITRHNPIQSVPWHCPQILERYLGTDLDVAWRAIGRTYLCRDECVHSDHKASGDECLWLTHERVGGILEGMPPTLTISR
jgi:hypothetical protein